MSRRAGPWGRAREPASMRRKHSKGPKGVDRAEDGRDWARGKQAKSWNSERRSRCADARACACAFVRARVCAVMCACLCVRAGARARVRECERELVSVRV
eukprot:6180764-Pleurochrysis_carterae.AAC.1